jgi:hypothetical protein
LEKKRALLEEHAPATLDLGPPTAGGVLNVLAEHLYGPGLRAAQADYGVEQHRLAGARSAHHTQDFTAFNRQV